MASRLRHRPTERARKLAGCRLQQRVQEAGRRPCGVLAAAHGEPMAGEGEQRRGPSVPAPLHSGRGHQLPLQFSDRSLVPRAVADQSAQRGTGQRLARQRLGDFVGSRGQGNDSWSSAVPSPW